MTWCWKLGRAAGVDVFLHWSFLLVPLYVIYKFYDDGLDVVGVVMVLTLAVFGCIILHEYGHVLTARFFGVQTQGIIITPIGGLAALERVRISPFQELIITLAGPAVNLLIAAALLVYLHFSGQPLLPERSPGGLTSFPQILMLINIILFLFNLVPAFPMDGGRILRSSLAMITNHDLATTIAVALGRGIAIVFVVVGFYFRDFTLGFVGIFIFLAAGIELSASRAGRVSQLRYQERQIPFRSDKS